MASSLQRVAVVTFFLMMLVFALAASLGVGRSQALPPPMPSTSLLLGGGMSQSAGVAFVGGAQALDAKTYATAIQEWTFAKSGTTHTSRTDVQRFVTNNLFLTVGAGAVTSSTSVSGLLSAGGGIKIGKWFIHLRFVDSPAQHNSMVWGTGFALGGK